MVCRSVIHSSDFFPLTVEVVFSLYFNKNMVVDMIIINKSFSYVKIAQMPFLVFKGSRNNAGKKAR